GAEDGGATAALSSGVGDDSAADGVGRAADPNSRVRFGDLRDLTEQIEALLGPADEVTGGDITAAQRFGQRLALGPPVPRSDPSLVGLIGGLEGMLLLQMEQSPPDVLRLVADLLEVGTRGPVGVQGVSPGLEDEARGEGRELGFVETIPQTCTDRQRHEQIAF